MANDASVDFVLTRSFNAPRALVSTNFVERDGRTELALHCSPLDASDAERTLFGNMHDSMRGGWGGRVDRLEAYVAAVQAG